MKNLLKLFVLLVILLVATQALAATFVLTWTDNSTNEDGFNIERKIGVTGTYTFLDSVGANVVTYTDLTPVAGTEYCYRVQGFNDGGRSGFTNDACKVAIDAPDGDPSNAIVIQIETKTTITITPAP